MKSTYILSSSTKIWPMNPTPLDHGCLGADYIGKPLGSVRLDVKSEDTKLLALSTVHLCW